MQATHHHHEAAPATAPRASVAARISSTPTPESAWIERITYVRGGDGARFLLVWTLDAHRRPGDVLLYGGVPAWLPGLLKAGRVGEGTTAQASVGAAYNRLVKGRYPYQRVSRRKIAKVLRGAR